MQPRPPLEEVSDYIALKGLDADAGHFVDYYTANGWRVGRAHMRDWRAALRIAASARNVFDKPRAEPKSSGYAEARKRPLKTNRKL